MDIVELFSIYC